MTHSSLKIGFIGLGIMGTPMAGHLLKAGHQLFVHTRSQVPAAVAEAGATACPNARAVAESADIIITMVPDTPDVEAVLFGANGVAEGLQASPCGPDGRVGKVVVDMSSISPVETKAFAQRIEALGCDYLDAPVSGGDVGARNGTLSIMVGGKPEVFERVRPVFEAMGKNITRVGDSGAGQTCKVANQIVVALTINAVAEGLLFAARAGADPAKVRQALMGGLATSRILEVHGERMIQRTVEPGFRIALHQKDLNLALGAARSLGLALPATAQAQQLFSACVAQGGAGWDHSGLVRALEKLSNFEIGQPAA
jgi:2-hydroxy-3-oxopropionate reductase